MGSALGIKEVHRVEGSKVAKLDARSYHRVSKRAPKARQRQRLAKLQFQRVKARESVRSLMISTTTSCKNGSTALKAGDHGLEVLDL